MRTLLLLLAFSSSLSAFGQALDFDGNDDGCVNFEDILGILAEYGQCDSNQNNEFITCGDLLHYNAVDYETTLIGDQCWFSENLRSAYFVNGELIPNEQSDTWNQDTQKVAIVESEKTALFMRLEFPDYTWMATGSLSGFKHEYLAPLKEFNVIAFPDNGAYDQWHQTATSMNELGFSIEVSTAIEDASYETGWDLVDVFLFEESKPETPGDEG